MSKKQTRRSISVSGDLYDRLKEYCDQHGLSLSGVVETQLRRHLGLGEVEPRPKQGSKRWDRAEAGSSPVTVPDRLTTIRQVAAAKVEPPPVAKTVTVTTPVLEKNGNWEKKVEPGEKKPGIPLDDLASKIFTF